MKYQKCIHYILSTYELWHINEHFENPLGSSVTVCVKTFLCKKTLKCNGVYVETNKICNPKNSWCATNENLF